MKKIYMITAIEFGYKYSNRSRSKDGMYHSYYKRTNKDQTKCFRIRDKTTLGWFKTLKKAQIAIKENWADMYEGQYNHAVIEEMKPGILAGFCVNKEWWFEWKGSWEEGGYQEGTKPKEYERIVGFYG